MTTTTFKKQLIAQPADQCLTMRPESAGELEVLTDEAITLAARHEYSKILARVPDWGVPLLEQKGFRLEAEVPHLFGKHNGFFLALHTDPQRSHLEKPQLRVIESVRNIAEASAKKAEDNYECPPAVTRDFVAEEAGAELVALYSRAYRNLDVSDAGAFVRESFEKGFRFIGLWEADRLIETVRLETNRGMGYVELAEFATAPGERGRNMAYHLLDWLIQALREEGIGMLYGLPGARSYGRNITFSKHGFRYGGTLRNQKRVASDLVSINVWYRDLLG